MCQPISGSDKQRTRPESLVNDIISQSVDLPDSHAVWDAVFLLPEIEILLPVLASAEYIGQIPARYHPAIQKSFQQNLLRNTVLNRTLNTIAKVFTKAGIELLLLKGAVSLVTPLFSKGARVMGDLDLLLHKKDIEKARDLLLDMGYGESDEAEEGAYCYPMLLDPKGLANIELHWEPFGGSTRQKLSAQELWTNKRTVSCGHGHCFIPAPELHFWLTLVHAAFKHTIIWQSYPVLVRNALELHAVMSKNKADFDTTALISTAREKGVFNALAHMLYIMHHDLALPLPQSLAALIQKGGKFDFHQRWIIWSRRLPPGLAHANYRLLHGMFHDGSFFQRLGSIFSVLLKDSSFLAPRAFILEIYGRKNPLWVYLLKPLHLFRILFLQIIIFHIYAGYSLGNALTALTGRKR